MIDADPGFSLCPECGGRGFLWLISEEERQARLQKVLQAYPDAGLDQKIDIFAGLLALNLESETVEDVRER